MLETPLGHREGTPSPADPQVSSIALATWAEADGTIELEDLCVDPGWRRRGVATALLSRIVDVLRAQGAECLKVTANPHARVFYSAAGFIDYGVAETDRRAAPRMRLAIH